MKGQHARLVFAALIGISGAIASIPAHAACTTPPGTEGDQFYNNTYHTMQFCNGTGWVNMGYTGATSGGVGTVTNNNFCLGNASGTVNCVTAAVNLATQVTGSLPVANGGTGTTALTQGSVVYAGGSGIYSQDNANLFWDATNHRLGIGTTAPVQLLHMYGSGTSVVRIETTAASGTNSGVQIIGGASNANWFIGTNRADLFGAGDSFGIYKNLGTAGAKLVINDDGNVGIGTTSPAAKFHVNASSGGRPTLFLSNSDFIASSAGSGVVITTGATSGTTFGEIYTFTTGNTAYGNLVIPGGNVGIGTTAPGALLHLNTTGLDQNLLLSSAAPSVKLANNATVGSATMVGMLAMATANGHFGVNAGDIMLGAYGNSRGNIYINSNYSGTGTKNVILQPGTGNVGIGSAVPAYRLDVNGDIIAGSGNWLRTRGSTGWYNETYSGGWNMSDTTWVRSYGGKSVYMANGFDTASASGVACSGALGGGYTLHICGTLKADSTITGTGITANGWFTSNDGANGLLQSGAGGLYLRATNANIYMDQSSLHVAGSVTSTGVTASITGGGYAINGSASCGTSGCFGVYASAGGINAGLARGDGTWAIVGTGSAYMSTNNYTGSDGRLKEDIHPISDGLATLGALRPVLYKWKKDTDQYKSVKEGNQPGLIAQEVQKVIPEVVITVPSMPVTPDANGRMGTPTLNQKLGTTYGVAYEKIVPYLIKAVQELFAKWQTDHDTLANLRREFEAYKTAHP